MEVLAALAATALVAWLYLLLGHGGFWRADRRLPPFHDEAPSPPDGWPSVVVVVPARDEASVLPSTLPSLLEQEYQGEFRVVLVDDGSVDGTAQAAAAVTGNHDRSVRVVHAAGPEPGWSGKVAAMATGVDAAGEPDYLLFTDADIAHPPDNVAALVAAARAGALDLVSLMARLRTTSRWERTVVPAFVYFFAQLFPFTRVARARSRIAAAAGGCMLVRRQALVAAGGLERIRGALIDDVALARLIKHRGAGSIWLGLATTVTSVRRYPKLADLWSMVARSAYTQLRHSPLLLAGTLLGLLIGYAVPPVAAVAGLVGLLVAGGPVAVFTMAAGATGWALMSATYLPTLRFYRVRAWHAPTLPWVAMLYAAMTVDSAWRHVRGRGGMWKGRPAPRDEPEPSRPERPG